MAGTMAAGAIWADTLSPSTGDLSLRELIDFLEPQEERTCVPVSIADDKRVMSVCADDQNGVPVVLPKRGGAISQSSYDYNLEKTSLEQACRELGSRCSYDIKKVISRMNQVIQRAASPP